MLNSLNKGFTFAQLNTGRLIELTEGGAEPEFLIQVATDEGGARLESSSRNVIKGSQAQLDAAAKLARMASEKLGNLFQGVGPDSGSVEFALSFEAETGVPVLAKGTVGASITVTLNWEK